MLKVTKKRSVSLLATVFVLFAIFAVAFLSLPIKDTLAQTGPDYGLTYAENVGLGTSDIRVSVVKVIRAILGILAILALGLIIYGGVVWMTAAGDAQKIATAKKILLNTVIGLIIILLAFAIVQYIFKVLSDSSGGYTTEPCTIGVCSGCLRCLDGYNYSFDDTCAPTCNLPLDITQFRIEDFQTSHAGATPKEDVYWCSKVQTVFNHNADASYVASAVDDGSLFVEQAGNSVVGDWTTRGKVLSYNPPNHVFPTLNAEHKLHLPSSLQDTNGRFLADCSLTAECNVTPPPDFQWFFNVGEDGDEVNPTITNTYPRSDDPNNIDKNVNLSPVIEVRFSEAIDITTVIDVNGLNPYPGNIYLHEVSLDGSGNIITEAQISNNLIIVESDKTGFKLHLDPPNILKPFTTYQITIKNIADLCGNIMQPDTYSWLFITNDKAPGFASVYPTGKKVCPDTKISATFNTSMYFNRVEMTINGVWNYNLFPDQGITSTSDANGIFRVVDVGEPISTHYRVYEFTPANNLNENTTYLISIVTDRIIDADKNLLMRAWEFAVTDLANCVCSPYISHLSKDQGPVGECITINGQCFRGTAAKPAIISNISVGGIDASIGAGYTNNYVATVIPDGFSPDERPDINLVIAYNSGGNVPRSNSKSFYINPGKAEGPCLWSIKPPAGKRGDQVELTGIRFGKTSTIRQSVFYPNAIANIAEADWSDTKLANVVVPALAASGEVFVRNDLGTSNGVYFNVAYCGNGLIDAGENCDGANLAGKDCSDLGFVGGVLACDTTTCQFNLETCSNAPSVVERSQCLLVCDNDPTVKCFKDSDCSSGGSCIVADSGLPSPNPYKNVNDVCLNVVMYAEFNTNIAPLTLNNNNVFLQKCSDNKCLNVEPDNIPATASPFGLKAVTLRPANNLEKNITYQATILNNITSLAGIPMEKDYNWRFTTKDSDALCPIDKIYVAPRKTTVGEHGTVNYSAAVIAPYLSANCTVINGESYNWQWSVADKNDPPIGISLTGGGPNITAMAGNTKGTVRVVAETENKKDSGELTVSFDTCDNDAECEAVCPGSSCDPATKRCTPVINALTPNSGPIGRWTTIAGCYFKTKSSNSQVKFGNTPVLTYPCDEIWTDKYIIVAVPNGLSLGSQPVTVTDRYNLPSNNSPFEVITECYSGAPVPSGGIPGLCQAEPAQAMTGDFTKLTGQNLVSENITTQVLFSGIASLQLQNITSKSLSAEIPNMTLKQADVQAIVADCPSNSLPFTVIQPPGVGEPCDGNTDTLTCDASNDLCLQFNPGLYCDISQACTCQPSTVSVIDRTPPNKATNVCRNVLISATLSQRVDTASLRRNFKVLKLATGSCGSIVIKKPSLWSRILATLAKLFLPSTQAQTETIVPGFVSVRYVNNTTVASFIPDNILDVCNKYQVVITGGDKGISTLVGGYMAADDSWEFTTGNEICDIDHVDVDIKINSTEGEITRKQVVNDYFSCAGRNDCSDDVDNSISGNQHQYLATAKDENNTALTADYIWSDNEEPGQDLIVLEGPVEQNNVLVTARLANGEAIVLVKASGLAGAEVGEASTSITITNFICRNPWPSLTTFPFTDSGNNCKVKGFTANCHDMTFSTFYCRDAGYEYDYCEGGDRDGQETCPGGICLTTTDGSPNVCSDEGTRKGEVCCPDGQDHKYIDDDLPDLKVKIKGERDDILKEFSFAFSDVDESGLIGIRFYNNKEHLSPSAWYEKYANNPTGSIAPKTIDDYEAIASGRTMYINAAVDLDPNGSHNIYTNMFLLSHSDYDATTLNIYNQMLDNLKFNINGISDKKVCSGELKYCTKDSDCATGQTCDANKTKLTRDTIRMGHLNEMIYHLDFYRGQCSNHNYLACLTDTDCPDHDVNDESCLLKNETYPTLPAGTYLAKQSVSVWDSWGNTFASVLGTTPLLDPINEVINCPDGYNEECWDETNKFFYCTPQSYMYHYQSTNNGKSYNIFMNMEYSAQGWNPKVVSIQTGTSVIPPCSPGAYNLKYSR